MFRRIGTNLHTLLLALVLALAVWVSAVTAADPDETRALPSPVAIDFVGQEPGLIATGQVPQNVQVTLRAARSVWDKLASGEASIRAVADLTGLGAGTHAVGVQVQVTAHPIRILSVSPRTLDLTLEALVTRTLPVALTLSGAPAVGYQTGEAVLDPSEVVISGPESLTARVGSIQCTLDITNARQSIETNLTVTAVDKNGLLLNGISIHPTSIKASLPLTQQGGYRDLAVKVVTGGRPASGYRLTNVAAFPPIVTVYSANTALIDSMPGYVETAPLDLSGLKEDINKNLGITLPPGVTLIGEQSVLVQVGIAPLEGSLTMSYRPVELIGLGTGLQAHLSPQTVDVILSGPLPVLDALLVSDVHVQVDVTGLAAGTYQLTPVIKTTDRQVSVDSILPGTVEVTILAAATPSH